MPSAVVDIAPYPFHLPMAQELMRSLANIYRTELESLAFVEQHGIDPLTITRGLSPYNLWHELLERAATRGVTRRLVEAARQQFPDTCAAVFDAVLAC
jgi:hypothetical protein